MRHRHRHQSRDDQSLGEELARKMLAQAGFGSVQVIDSPRPQNCIYISRPGSDETRDE
jgi:hypothetical protein